MSEPQQDVIITGFKNPTSEGIVIELNKPARLKTGTGHFKEFFISWDKIGKALIEGYTEKMEVNDLRELRKDSDPALQDAVKEKLRNVVKVFAKIMFYGGWKWENPNERVITMLMQELELYPFKNEDEMIIKTDVSEELYQEAQTKVPTA